MKDILSEPGSHVQISVSVRLSFSFVQNVVSISFCPI